MGSECSLKAAGRSRGAQEGRARCSFLGAAAHAQPSLPSPQQANYAFYRCSVLLKWRLPHTLFCALAWEKGLCARHILWSSLVRARSREGMGGWPPGPRGRPALAPASDRDMLPR